MIPFDKRSGKIWYNNELVEWQDAKCHVISHGLHYASLVFEGERVYDGEIFKLEEHTDRLFYSAKRLDINIPYTKDEINEASKKIDIIRKDTYALKNNFFSSRRSKKNKHNDYGRNISAIMIK